MNNSYINNDNHYYYKAEQQGIGAIKPVQIVICSFH